MNICLVSDEKFAEICTVAMVSIIKHNSNVTFYIIEDNIIDDTKKTMVESIKELDQSCSMHFIHAIDIKDRFGTDFDTGIWPMACMQRLFLCELLPKEIERVLYLDCDVMVRKPLDDLYNIDFNNSFCAAVPDCTSELCRKNIGLKEKDCYFNSGVYLLNIKKWREENIKEKFIKILNSRHLFQYPDQDILNMVFSRTNIRLDAKYNFTSYMYGYNYDELMYYHNATEYINENEFYSARKDPSIFHFTNDVKLVRPWYKNSNHPFLEEWLSYRRLTKWSKDELWQPNYNFNFLIKRFIVKFFPSKTSLYLSRKVNYRNTKKYMC